MTNKFLIRTILMLLWAIFLLWVYGKDRQTRSELEQQQEKELEAALVLDADYQTSIHTRKRIKQQPEYQVIRRDIKEHQLEQIIDKAMEEIDE